MTWDIHVEIGSYIYLLNVTFLVVVRLNDCAFIDNAVAGGVVAVETRLIDSLAAASLQLSAALLSVLLQSVALAARTELPSREVLTAGKLPKQKFTSMAQKNKTTVNARVPSKNSVL